LFYPEGVIVDQLGHVYVADSGNRRVMRWCKGAMEGNIVVGGNGAGKRSNQFYYPIGLSFDRLGNLYVADDWSHRVQKFEIDSN
jgi:sugar lactone lactonase YvrE